MSFASEITSGNVSHIKQGREPNAGACIFPSIPIIPVFFCGIAWLLDKFISEYSLVIVIVIFAILFLWWAWSFARLRRDLTRLISKKQA